MKDNSYFLPQTDPVSLQYSTAKKLFIIFLMVTLMLTLLASIAFAEFVSPGKLTASHKELAGLKNCIKCHSIGKGIPDTACT
ncbi:MAG: hypothetical protein JSV03_11465, partial [Planctomycetota bacterium]